MDFIRGGPCPCGFCGGLCRPTTAKPPDEMSGGLLCESTCVRSEIWLGVSEIYSGDAAMFAVMFSAPSA